MASNTPHPRTAARRGALKALVAVETSDTLLSVALAHQHSVLDARPFMYEIATGALRHLTHLDYSITPFLRKPLQSLDAPVRNALRLAAYERAFLNTPVRAISDEYAGLMRGEKLTSAVGFVNAITRRLPDQLRASPEADKHAVDHLSIEYSHPAWLVERWLKRLGLDEALALCQANNQIAPLSLRVNTLRASRDEVLAGLQARGVAARAGSLSPHAIIVENAGDPTHWPEWKEGLILAQDEAAQLVGLLADPQQGQTVIDAAAAPGGKTTHLAQLMHDSGQVIACDVAPGRLKLIEENTRRLGLQSVELRTGDFRQLVADLPQADLVLLDAPCLGTGTLRRRPDAKWRKTPEQLKELTLLQHALLDAAASAVRSGGALVYSTCSLEPEENEEQIHHWLSLHPDWKVETPTTIDSIQHNVSTSEGFLQTQPHRSFSDGMFAAKLRRMG